MTSSHHYSHPAPGPALVLDIPDGVAPSAPVIRDAAELAITIGDPGCIPAADAAVTAAATDGLARAYDAGQMGWQGLAPAGFFTFQLSGVQAGSVDAGFADAPLALRIALRAEACGTVDGPLSITGTTFGDVVEITGPGRGGWRSDREIVEAQLGAGDDLFTAEHAKSIDRVWGGSGDDIVRTGSGNDALFGDHGTLHIRSHGGHVGEAEWSGLGAAQLQGATTIAVEGDPTRVHLGLGESSDPEAWVEGTGAELYFRHWQDEQADAQDSAFVTDYDGSAAHVAALDPNRYLSAGGTLVEGEFVPSRQTATVWNAYSAGIGLDTPGQGFTITSGAADKSGLQNPEINTGPYESRLCYIEGIDPPGLKGNYVESVWQGGRGIQVDGIGYAVPRSDLVGVELGQDATAVELTFSMLYGTEPGAVSETALIVLRDSSQADPVDPANSKGKVVGYTFVSATASGEDGVIAQGGAVASLTPFQPAGGNAETAIPTDADGTGSFAVRQPGLVQVSLGQLAPGVTFDTVEVRSGGYWQASGAGADAVWSPGAQPTVAQQFKTNVSDMLLREICFEPETSPGNDILDAGEGADLLQGGHDQASVHATITVTYEGSKAAYGNGFGIYDRDSGLGTIIDGNVKTGAATHQRDFDLADIEDVGFFALVNPKNDGLNGASVEVGASRVTLQNGASINAVHTDDALNTGGQRMAINDQDGRITLAQDGRRVADRFQHEATGDGAIAGRIGFEDLVRSSDRDFNDVVLKVVLDVTVEGGDELFLGRDGRRLDGDRDVVVYGKGDGFDRIAEFEAGRCGRGGDELHLTGFDADEVILSEGVRVNGKLGTLITFEGAAADQGLFLEGVSGLTVSERPGDWLLVG